MDVYLSHTPAGYVYAVKQETREFLVRLAKQELERREEHRKMLEAASRDLDELFGISQPEDEMNLRASVDFAAQLMHEHALNSLFVPSNIDMQSEPEPVGWHQYQQF